MKPSERNELIDALIEGDITEADFLRLEAEMCIDPAARKAYFDRVALTQALREEASSASAMKAVPKMKLPPSWISWRPLTAAAAGLVIGLFSASLVFGFAGGFSEGMTRTDIAVADADFERAEMKLEQGFPSGPQAWAVDDAEGVPGPDGGRVLRLRPWEKNPYSRLVQIVDVSRLTAEGEKELVLAASFRTSDPQHASRYKLRLFGFEESADAVPPFPLETKESGIVTLSQVLDVPAGTNGWQRFSTKMPMPSGVKSVVIWIGASTRPQPGPKVTHFVDDVTLTLDVHQPAAR